jgi:hypothetical protein
MAARRLHAAICCYARALASLLLFLPAPSCASAADVTFLVTSDSHHDALENEDRNERNRATIDEMKRYRRGYSPTFAGKSSDTNGYNLLQKRN